MACPYFMPTERLVSDLWPHRARLPLGDGFRGVCTAPGHEGAALADEELRDFCNLGYARRCPRLPQGRTADAVRFIVTQVREDLVALYFTCERDHAPRDHGPLAYDRAQQRWINPHPDARIQRMAECYVQSYFSRRQGGFSTSATT
ncbi:MAG: hypothetical protein LAN37_08560 [Acidobacteriia bacterium]|nr:hypothetical protein [Terriglobia bacterium]